MIKEVTITGGTHGNELIGIYLVKSWLKDSRAIQRSNFKTSCYLLNKKAIKECRRYIDRDLNRCFNTKILSSQSELYEENLAKEIDELLGKKGSDNPKSDFIVDLHTTTANMGLSIVVSNENQLTWEVISYIKDKVPELNVYMWRGDEEDSFVDSIAPNGFAIEVGAIPQGVLRSDLYQKTEQIVYHLLDFIEIYNSDKSYSLRDVEYFEHVMLVNYPKDKDGDIEAMVHEDRQDRDFELISTGEPLFRRFDGEIISYEGEDLYTLFINEAAYYEKGFAMTLARKSIKNI